MTSAAFDTLQAAQALQEAGIERGHAEAIAHIVGWRSEDYATKGDLAELEARLEAKIENLEARIEAKVEQAKNVILRSVLASSVAIIVTLLGGIITVISTG